MTTSRSKTRGGDWRIWIAWLAIACGTGGYAYCWSIMWGVQRSVATDRQSFEMRTEQRSFEIEWKGGRFFVEPDEGHRYEQARTAMLYIWAVAAGGFIYLIWRGTKKRDR